MATVEVSRDSGNHNYHTPADGVAGSHHVISSFCEGLVQAVVGPVIMGWDSVQRAFDLRAIARELLQQFYIVMVAHHRHFICRLETH